MEKDLLTEMGFEDEEEREKEEKDSDNSENETYEDCIEQDFDGLGSQIKDLQLQVENAMKEQFDLPMKKKWNNDHEHSEKISATTHSEKQNDTKDEPKQNDESIAVENVIIGKEHSELASSHLTSEINPHDTQEQIVLSTEDEPAFTKDYFDTRSMWNASIASTIAPLTIKRRMKVALDKRDRKNQSKKIVIKGEASAVTRIRRDNRATIKESTGIWGWE